MKGSPVFTAVLPVPSMSTLTETEVSLVDLPTAAILLFDFLTKHELQILYLKVAKAMVFA
jgi:hypothetical protein